MRRSESTSDSSIDPSPRHKVNLQRVMIAALCLVIVSAVGAIGLKIFHGKRAAHLSHARDKQAVVQPEDQPPVSANNDSDVNRADASSRRSKGVKKPVGGGKTNADSRSASRPASPRVAKEGAGPTAHGQVVRAKNSVETDNGDHYDDKPKYTEPDGAMRFRRLQMQDENGFIPPDGLEKARRQVERMKAAREGRIKAREQAGLPTEGIYGAGIEPDSWEWLGPGNVGGRIRSIIVHPFNPDLIWLGSVGGGIWRTTNGGTTWQPVDDFLANLAVSTMIMDPDILNTMYAGTGEGFTNIDALQGAGIFKTINGGIYDG